MGDNNLQAQPKTTQGLQSVRSQKRLRQPWGDAERAVRQRRILEALKRLNIERLLGRGRSVVNRGHKWQQRRRTVHATKTKCPVFILGSNRSGTQMVCEAIGHSPHGWDYRESELSPAFRSYYLRADWLIKWLIRHAPAPVVSFGSILDSQSAEALLGRFENARAIWVYRRYEDAANSSVRNWDHLNDLVHAVARGETERLGARGEGISQETVQLFGELFHEELSQEDGACLYWYMRNQLYFDLNLDMDPRILLVQYEDAVLNQERAFRRVFDFLGSPYDPAIVSHIFASSLGKSPWPGIEPHVQTVCDGLKAKLDAHYARTSDWKPEQGSNIR